VQRGKFRHHGIFSTQNSSTHSQAGARHWRLIQGRAQISLLENAKKLCDNASAKFGVVSGIPIGEMNRSNGWHMLQKPWSFAFGI